MKTLHTPEPWHAGSEFSNDENTIFADEGRMALEDGGTTLYPICTVVKMTNHAAEDEANTRLITSAPEMLGALVAASKWISYFAPECSTALRVKSAIAKATGKNQLERKGD